MSERGSQPRICTNGVKAFLPSAAHCGPLPDLRVPQRCRTGSLRRCGKTARRQPRALHRATTHGSFFGPIGVKSRSKGIGSSKSNFLHKRLGLSDEFLFTRIAAQIENEIGGAGVALGLKFGFSRPQVIESHSATNNYLQV